MATSWKKTHHKSGATDFEKHVDRCKLTVVPRDWTNPRGPSIWAVTCKQPWDHKRGSAISLANAKKNAIRAAKHMSRQK